MPLSLMLHFYGNRTKGGCHLIFFSHKIHGKIARSLLLSAQGPMSDYLPNACLSWMQDGMEMRRAVKAASR